MLRPPLLVTRQPFNRVLCRRQAQAARPRDRHAADIGHIKRIVAGVELRRAWKDYDFDVLDQFTQEGLIGGSRKAKSVYLTEAGIGKAEALAKKYLKGDV